MAGEDIIDINIDTGKIKVTPKEGNDEVRFVDGSGKVQDKYTYGKNGSFKKDFTHTETTAEISGTSGVPINGLKTNNIKQAEKLFEKISQNSNIEWEFLKFTHQYDQMPDFVAIGNTGDALNTDEYMTSGFGNKYLSDNEERLYKSSYRLSIHEHNHPLGSPPSGYLSRFTVNFDMFPDRGDASFSHSLRKRKISSPDIKFYVNPKGKNFKYKYNGVSGYEKINK